jgi:RecA/RadA recombinase
MTRHNDTLPDSGLLFVNAGDYDRLEPSFDFIPGLLHDSTVGIIYGPPGSGKTFFALHLLCCAALGKTVFGLTPLQRNGLYVGLEGEAGIKARVSAWCGQNRVEANPIDEDKDITGLIERIRRRKIGFLVIDTLSLAMAGLDEISGQHMSLVINALHRIKRETGACVVAIAHTGKNEKAGIRGHSSQLGNVDTTIEIVCHNKDAVREGDKTRIVEHEITLATPRSAVVRKQRDGEGGRRFHFTLTLRDTLFRDARGAVLKRPTLREHAAIADLPEEEAQATTRKLTRREEDAAEILDALYEKRGRLGPATVNQYRRALKREGSGPENPRSWRRAFHDLKASMQMISK